MRNIYLSIILSLGFLLSGCASIVGNTSENVAISSNVDDVEITVRNKKNIPVYKGKTPTIIALKKGAGYFQGEKYSILANKKGYNTQKLTLDTDVSALYIFGNLIFGGLIGWFIVDPDTGAMWTFDEDTVFFNMEKN